MFTRVPTEQPETYDPTSSPSIDKLHANVERLLTELQGELTPSQYALVRRVVDDAESVGSAIITNELDHIVEGLARHFPGIALAIRAVASHLSNESAANPCRCHQPWPDSHM